MDSNPNHFFDSQREDDDPILSQPPFSQSTFYPFSHPSFHMPPHGYQTMMNSPSISPNSPFMFRPPNYGSQIPPPHPSPTLNAPTRNAPGPHFPMATHPSHPSPPLSVTSPNSNMDASPDHVASNPSPNPTPNFIRASQPKARRAKPMKRKEAISLFGCDLSKLSKLSDFIFVLPKCMKMSPAFKI
ncbi:hypothetical protein GOP47_0021108 [Adiantum capillus-veneris]|uniref:Uncharacterized protein n=1 Tax=Adiantum capillus-veneris TaxID=13818 RepID=A0A9D4UAH1_ADICA|nr:hypothetical protein GOP47_0021108 [Adiantum capillus-veneris]